MGIKIIVKPKQITIDKLSPGQVCIVKKYNGKKNYSIEEHYILILKSYSESGSWNGYGQYYRNQYISIYDLTMPQFLLLPKKTLVETVEDGTEITLKC